MRNLIVLLALAACHESAPAPTAPAPAPVPFSALGYDITPRTYEVPAGRAAEVRRLIHSMSYPVAITSDKGAQTQFVQPQPTFTNDGHVVVVVPNEYQDAVADLMKVVAAEPQGATSAAYDVTYFVVRADPSTTPGIPAGLTEIAPTLQALTGLGDRAYSIVDRVSARTVDGEESSINGRTTDVEQTLTTTPGGLELQVKITESVGNQRPNQIDTKLAVQAGQTVVLGDAMASTGDGLVLYVVRISAAA